MWVSSVVKKIRRLQGDTRAGRMGHWGMWQDVERTVERVRNAKERRKVAADLICERGDSYVESGRHL
jgi:hypothetical protein